MPPIDRALYIPVFHGIDVDIVHVVGVVPIITNEVLPKTPLPNAALPFRFARCTNQFRLRMLSRKRRFYCANPGRKICVIRRQCHKQVKVIRQHNHRVNMKRMRRFHVPQRVPQDADVFDERYCTTRAPFYEIRGDETGCACNVCTSILHDARIALMLGLMRPVPPTAVLLTGIPMVTA